MEKKFFLIMSLTVVMSRSTKENSAALSKWGKPKMIKERQNKAGGDLARGGKRRRTHKTDPQSVWRGRLEPGGSLEARS